MHEDNYAHRDIKLSNFLLSFDGMVKLADFGLTIRNDFNITPQECGSDHYKAPECIFGVHKFVMEDDMFAAGLVMLNLLCGCDDEELNFYDLLSGHTGQ